ncbi:MAG: cysteine desulfurase family protein [bacterium]
MLYFDHNATTPLCDEAREAMLPWIGQLFGNPSSIHAAGRQARAAIDHARDRIASLLGAKPHEIIFTSGGTESCNLALAGLAHRHRSATKNHLLTVVTEHHAVLHTMRSLAKKDRYELTEIPVGSDGLIDLPAFEKSLRPETLLVSVMVANNETGVIQPIRQLASLCRERGILFHTDAVQAYGKLPCFPNELGVDALSLTAHKFYGPLGAGLLWLRSGVSIEAIQHGGYHENERRPGTENVAAIAGMAAAAERAGREVKEGSESMRQVSLRDRLWQGISTIDSTALWNGKGGMLVANTLNVSFPKCDGETLLMALDLEGVGASSGSACMVGSIQASHVLVAMGLTEETARATVRFSLGRHTTEGDVDATLAALGRVLNRQVRV